MEMEEAEPAGSAVEHHGDASWPAHPASIGALDLVGDSLMADAPSVVDPTGFPETAPSDPPHVHRTPQDGCEGEADSFAQPSTAFNTEDSSLRAQPLPELVSSDVHEVTARRKRRRSGTAGARSGAALDEEDGDAEPCAEGRVRRKSAPSARAQPQADEGADGEDERTGARRSSLRGTKRHDYR